jgi:hypothetical protein
VREFIEILMISEKLIGFTCTSVASSVKAKIDTKKGERKKKLHGKIRSSGKPFITLKFFFPRKFLPKELVRVPSVCVCGTE